MNGVIDISKQVAVVMPCHNAAETVVEAVASALQQSAVSCIYIVDDASTDDSFGLLHNLASRYPSRIKVLQTPVKSGAAVARNWGVMHVNESIVAFLDADDVYRPHALDAAVMAFHCIPQLAMVRLPLHPWGVPEKYAAHEGFKRAWRSVEMTGAGNMVILKTVFLAAGGFPQDALFRRFGGEDAALGLALHDTVMVGTLFEDVGVLYRYKSGSHCQRLLNAHLFQHMPEGLLQNHLDEANAVTERIVQNLKRMSGVLAGSMGKVVPLLVEEAKA